MNSTTHHSAIADAQVHIWAPDAPGRPWRAGRAPHRQTALGAVELLGLMDEAGVQRAVLIPPSWDCDRNDLVLDAAVRWPRRFAAMGRFDPHAPGARGTVARWSRQPGMRGMRVNLLGPADAEAVKSGRLDWFWQEAEEAAVPIDLLTVHGMVHLFDRTAERHPRLKIAICHLALATGERDAQAFREFDKLLPIARRPNVMVKATALPAYTSEPYPFRTLQGYIRRVYDAFGPRRMFWGTDLARLPCTYRQAVTLFTEELPWLGAEDKEWIMGRGLCKWLEWS